MMEGAKGCFQRSDTKNMPQFLDQVSDVRENEASRHFAISLYGELAQLHKQAIIPYIPRMMVSIVRSLPFSADSHQLHESCAKAVSSMARYTIDPTRPYDSNQQILFNLCSPLLPVLASKVESSAAGAAICLQALVESEKWKFAHPDLQGIICSKASNALSERGVHLVAVLHLVKSLAKFSRDASHCHLAEWVRIGLQVLQTDSGLPGSRQQRVVAAQVIAVILKTADLDKLEVDLYAITKILEACLLDKVTIVQIAVAEALETIKGIALEKRMHHDSAGSGSESKRRSSDVEESGLQELSGSTSPRSDTSSHEAVPSMVSAKVKFGMGPSRINQQARDSLSLRSHASLNFSRPSEHKEITPAAIPRRVVSEIPMSGRLPSNPDVLPSLYLQKSLSRLSVDFKSKEDNFLVQDKGFLGSEKSTQFSHTQILDSAKKTNSFPEKHAEGCLNLSNLGCTCTFSKEEDRSNTHLASIDQLTGKINSESFDDFIEEGMLKLPMDSSCKRCYVNDDCVADVQSSGRTGDCLSGTDASNFALTEGLIAVEAGSNLQAKMPHALEEEFAFRAPCSLLHSMQSSSSTDGRGENCTDFDSRIPKTANLIGSDHLSRSSESEESRVAAHDYESRIETSGASCLALEDANSSEDHMLKSGSRVRRQSNKKINDLHGERMSVAVNKCETCTFGYDWSPSRGTSDSGFGNDRKDGSRQNVNLRRSSKKNGRWKRSSAQREGHIESSAAVSDGKPRGVDLSGRECVPSEMFKKQIYAGTSLVIVCAVAILAVAVMVTRHVNQIYDSHALVPT